MAIKLFKGIVIFSTIFFIYGCRTPSLNVKPVTVRAYAQDKTRVDQELQGNAGYLAGTPQESQEERKKTRRIYVLEVTQVEEDVSQKQDLQIVDQNHKPLVESIKQPVQKTSNLPSPEPEITIPSFDDEEFFVEEQSSPEVPSLFIEYTVEKEDTLQKISKKFYDSYSKWPKIYELNKLVIKDPNRIKPGTVIKIPME